MELRETIDLLKSKNSEAQAVIQGALNPHDPAPRGKSYVQLDFANILVIFKNVHVFVLNYSFFFLNCKSTTLGKY